MNKHLFTALVALLSLYILEGSSHAVAPQVAAGLGHTVGLQQDGTVVALGWNHWTQCDVGTWSNMLQISAGWYHTVGLKSDGTVVATGWNYYGECGVDSWSGIVQVSAGDHYTVGVKADGTAVALGYNYSGQCDISSWSGIMNAAAGENHTVGVKTDGTVVAAGWNSAGQCNAGSWSGIVQAAAGWAHTVGVKADGTAVALGDNSYGQCNVGSWSNIVQVAAGEYHTVGLKADGTVVAAGRNQYGQCDVGSWSEIVQVATIYSHTVGLRSDGTVVAVGYNDDGQCTVSGWNLITMMSSSTTTTVSPSTTTQPSTSTTTVPAGPCMIEWAGDLSGTTNTSQNARTIQAALEFLNSSCFYIKSSCNTSCDDSHCTRYCWPQNIFEPDPCYINAQVGVDGTWSQSIYYDYVPISYPCIVNRYNQLLCPRDYEGTWYVVCEATLIKLSSFAATPQSGEVVLSWSTASELDNAGFNIYRSEAETGEYVKINDALIPALGSATQGAAYEFTDKNVRLWRMYFYKLEDIDTNSTATSHGPVNATPRLLHGLSNQ